MEDLLLCPIEECRREYLKKSWPRSDECNSIRTGCLHSGGGDHVRNSRPCTQGWPRKGGRRPTSSARPSGRLKRERWHTLNRSEFKNFTDWFVARTFATNFSTAWKATDSKNEFSWKLETNCGICCRQQWIQLLRSYFGWNLSMRILLPTIGLNFGQQWN